MGGADRPTSDLDDDYLSTLIGSHKIPRSQSIQQLPLPGLLLILRHFSL